MQNIATIYRFKTPFLNLKIEKDFLPKVLDKINKLLLDDWLKVNKNIQKDEVYYKITLNFWDNFWKIIFMYINKIWIEKYLPIFKMDVFLYDGLLKINTLQKTTNFLTSLFECFDWLNEKEYLLEINKNIYYKKWFFNTKVYPHFDFTSIEKIEANFKNKNWNKLLEEFISKFRNNDFLLTLENSDKYHKIHSIVLYYIYLIYIMYRSILQATNTIWDLKKVVIEDYHLDLSKKRLEYINVLSMDAFKKYYEKLEKFFSLFE